MKIRTFKLIVTCLVFLLASCSEDKDTAVIPVVDPIEEPEVPNNATVLKDRALFGIGAAVKVEQLNGDFSSTLNENFNQITGEYEMKMAHIWTGENSYSWTKADALVDYAMDNGMEIHGHTLVWYKSFPTWFKNANYDSATFESKVKNYIETVVARYKGKVKSWDVANEIFNDNGSLRMTDCPVYKTFDDPVAFYGRCFQYARATDPDTKLFYNDYSVVLASGKRYAMKQMVSRFKAEGYPIDGLGDQFHYMASTDINTIKNGLADMASTGLLIHMSELDIRINVDKKDDYVYTQTEQQKHANAYKAIVEAYELIPQDQKFAITTWGLSDNATWLTDWWHPKEYPLLFDDNYEKKETYFGFLEGLK